MTTFSLSRRSGKAGRLGDVAAAVVMLGLKIHEDISAVQRKWF